MSAQEKEIVIQSNKKSLEIMNKIRDISIKKDKTLDELKAKKEIYDNEVN